MLSWDECLDERRFVGFQVEESNVFVVGMWFMTSAKGVRYEFRIVGEKNHGVTDI